MPDVSQIMADIEAWLDKATPGEWKHRPVVKGNHGELLRDEVVSGRLIVIEDVQREEDAADIAACSPVCIRALLDDAWVSLPADARDRLLAEARAGYGDLLADLTDAVQLALVEEAARDAARAAWPGLGAELVWETLHLMPLETP